MGFYLLLFYEFFKIGLFSVGGGLATLPFLYDLAEKYNWFDITLIPDMLAISESTPGPIGINMATYVGMIHSGLPGAIVATVGIVTPSIIIIIIISNFLEKFSESQHVKDVFSTLRPSVIGLIGAVGLGLIIDALFNTAAYGEGVMAVLNIPQIILFALLVFFTNKYKKHPIFYIIISAAVGIIFSL